MSFDWAIALAVGFAVLAGSVLTVFSAMILPFVAIERGKTWLGTLAAVVGIGSTVAIVGGYTAGYYRGMGGGGATTPSSVKDTAADVVVKTSPKPVSDSKAKLKLTARMDVAFQRDPANPSNALNAQCSVVTYEMKNGTQLSANGPQDIKEANPEAFFTAFSKKLDEWLKTPLSDAIKDEPRSLIVYMDPFPGNGVYERILQLATERNIKVNKITGRWSLPDELMNK